MFHKNYKKVQISSILSFLFFFHLILLSTVGGRASNWFLYFPALSWNNLNLGSQSAAQEGGWGGGGRVLTQISGRLATGFQLPIWKLTLSWMMGSGYLNLFQGRPAPKLCIQYWRTWSHNNRPLQPIGAIFSGHSLWSMWKVLPGVCTDRALATSLQPLFPCLFHAKSCDLMSIFISLISILHIRPMWSLQWLPLTVLLKRSQTQPNVTCWQKR